uniref:Uncharacterized protein n=1 Tax=Rhizophora mucronata TaxID=61149 RepID=A0A2P2NCD3_RHIMU
MPEEVSFPFQFSGVYSVLLQLYKLHRINYQYIFLTVSTIFCVLS